MADAHPKRREPNILITGTPGTGKTTTAESVAQATGLAHVCVGDWIKEKGIHGAWDDEYMCYELDEDGEDKFIDELDAQMIQGGNVLDYHACEWFPERWFDLVVVLRTNTEPLYDRLTARGYAGVKLNDNLTCEIMNVIAEEAQSSYKPDIVREMASNTVDDMDENVDAIKQFVETFRAQNSMMS